jgi:hypothetical protein
MNNELATKESNDRYELNTLLNDIELAVQRGTEAQERDGVIEEHTQPNFTMRLRNVTEMVSSAGGRLGLLDRVKGLNKLLEQVIAKG